MRENGRPPAQHWRACPGMIGGVQWHFLSVTLPFRRAKLSRCCHASSCLRARSGAMLCPEAPCLTCVCEYVQAQARQPVVLASHGQPGGLMRGATRLKTAPISQIAVHRKEGTREFSGWLRIRACATIDTTSCANYLRKIQPLPNLEIFHARTCCHSRKRRHDFR